MSELLKNLVDVCADPELEGVLTNLASGEASEFSDPAELMLTLVGNNVFTEGYYDEALDLKQRKAGVEFSELPPRARLLVSAAQEIARGDNPRDLLALASWGRCEAHMRRTPQWLVAVAAHEPKTKPFVVDYCNRRTNGPILRTDDILEVFKAYVTLYGSPLPNCLKKGLAKAYTRQTEGGLLKYNPDVWPRHRDVLHMVDRRANYPLSNAMAEFLNSGNVVDPKATPILAKRKQLYAKGILDTEAIELAKETRATWENLSSQFGGTKEVWELGVEIMTGKTSLDGKPKTNYMAVLRNLCNMAEAEIDGAHWSMVIGLLTNENEVKNSQQWPYRWLTAYDEVLANRAFQANPIVTNSVVGALDKAIQLASRNIFNFYGTTVVAPDHSGSMSTAKVGGKEGKIFCRTAADVAAVLAYYASEKAFVIPFGSSAENVSLDPDAGFFENLRRVQHCSVGHATNGDAVIRVMQEMGIEADRVVYFSDCQIYGNMTARWNEYRKTQPECWMHNIDLAGYGLKIGNDSVLDSSLQTQQGGYSEKLLNFCVRAELARKQKQLVKELELSPTEKVETTSSLPSMDYIRENF